MLSNEIILRPRFQLELQQPCAQLLMKFSEAKKKQNKYIISCVDEHIFIKLPRNEQHFWSPQLHLEITEKSEFDCSLQGFFGPNPTMWTMFIFLHVGVGILFMVNLTWLYSNYNLGNSLIFQIGISFILVLMWILLYVAGRLGKKKGKPGMMELYEFMLKTI